MVVFGLVLKPDRDTVEQRSGLMIMACCSVSLRFLRFGLMPNGWYYDLLARSQSKPRNERERWLVNHQQPPACQAGSLCRKWLSTMRWTSRFATGARCDALSGCCQHWFVAEHEPG